MAIKTRYVWTSCYIAKQDKGIRRQRKITREISFSSMQWAEVKLPKANMAHIVAYPLRKNVLKAYWPLEMSAHPLLWWVLCIVWCQRALRCSSWPPPVSLSPSRSYSLYHFEVQWVELPPPPSGLYVTFHTLVLLLQQFRQLVSVN